MHVYILILVPALYIHKIYIERYDSVFFLEIIISSLCIFMRNCKLKLKYKYKIKQTYYYFAWRNSVYEYF